MCGRYAISVDPEQLAARFDATVPAEQYLQRQNASPSERLPVLRNTGERRIDMLRWGLIPSWAKDPSISSSLINARAETLEEKPSFRDAFKKRRCLVLADAFYEWQTTPDEAHPGKTRKQPVRIALKSGEPFAFAGLWEQWTSGDGEIVPTFTIITTQANDLIAPIHARMPVILTREGEAMWLDNTLAVEKRRGLLLPFMAEAMQIGPADDAILKQRGA